MSVDIGGKIKKIRVSKGLSQSALAQKAGIAQSTLSYVEKNDKHPQFNTLSAICKGLDVTVFELLSYGEKKSSKKMFEEQLKAASIFDSNVALGGQEFEKYLYEKYLQVLGE